MRVNLGTVDVDDRIRRAIRHSEGGSGLATRAEVRNFYLNAAAGEIENVLGDLPERARPHATEGT